MKNSKFYIGSSISVNKRVVAHMYKLKNGEHCNLHLQQSFDKEDSVFKILLLEKCSEDDLIVRENYWIGFYNCYEEGYNQCVVSEARGNVFTADTKSKMSSVKMKGKTIWMCDKKTGERLIGFESLFRAGEYISKSGVSQSLESHIRMRISNVARNKQVSVGHGFKSIRLSAYGYKWEVV